MGWIHAAQPAKQLHQLATAVEKTKHNKDLRVDEVDKKDATNSDTAYPIQSKHVEDKDLLFIPCNEIKKRDGKDGTRLFIVVDNLVLDCTAYIAKHPGGQQIVLGFGGQDCSWQWWTFHNRQIWNDVAVALRVGRTEGMENPHVRPKAFVGLRPLGYLDDW